MENKKSKAFLAGLSKGLPEPIRYPVTSSQTAYGSKALTERFGAAICRADSLNRLESLMNWINKASKLEPMDRVSLLMQLFAKMESFRKNKKIS